MKQTTTINAAQVNKKWYLVDATDLTLGRLSTQVAAILKGKHKVDYTPHVDCGDNIVIINASKVHLTGDKLDKKKYYNHSQFLSGMRVRPAKEMLEHYPEEMLRKAIHGMLPKTKLGRKIEKNLYIYGGSEHKQEAQNLEVLKIENK